MGQIIDLADQRFGRLTALYPTGKRDKKGSVIWHCRCDCGRETEAAQDNLVYGSCRSCGCLKQEICREVHNRLHLIDGTCVERLVKRKSRQDNTSGFRGVSRTKNGRYRVQIGFKGRCFYIGTYSGYEEAVQKRLEVEDMIHNSFVNAYYAWEEKASADAGWAKENPLVFEVEKINGSIRVITQ